MGVPDLSEMRGWLTPMAAGAALLLSAISWLSGDRLGVERRVTTLEAKSATEEAYRKAVLARLDALCRVTPQAKCPLGENER